MSIKYYANKVQETSTTTGQGNLLLAGSPIGFKNFISTIGPNNKFTYYIHRIDSNLEWEIGVGYILSSGGINQLVRETVISSTNLDSLVGFTAGTKYVEPIIGENMVNNSFVNVETKTSNFTAPYVSATYLVDASSGNIQVSLPQVSAETDPVVLGFLLKDTIGSQYQQLNAISIVPSGSETINGSSSAELDIIQDYLQIVSVPAQSGWYKLDPIQDSTYPYGNDGTIQIKYDSAFSGVSNFKWNTSNSALLIGGTGTMTSADIILPASGQTIVFNEQSLDKDFRVEGSGNAYLLFLDASTNKIALNTSNATDTLTVNSQNGAGITVYKSGVGPKLVLSNTSVSGVAVDNIVGHIIFSGLNSANSSVEYARIYSTIDSNLSTSENSSVSIEIVNNGSNENVAVLSASGINLGFDNQNIDGIILGGASSNEGNNIVLGYYNTICGENCIVVGNTIDSSGNFGGILGYNHAVSGNNIWVFGGSGISVSGDNRSYLGINNNNHIAIVNSGSLDYTTFTNKDVNINVYNKAILSSGIKETVNFGFTNSNGVAKTGVKIGSNILSVTNNNESANLYAQTIHNGSVIDILSVGGSGVNIGPNTTSNNIVCGLNNTINSTGNIVYGKSISSSGNNNILVGDNIVCSGSDITILGSDNTCLSSGNLGIVILGNNNISNEDYAVSIGNNNASSGLYSVSCGYNNGAHGSYAVSIGSNNSVLSNSSVAVGRNNSLNNLDLYSTMFAVGIGNYAEIYGSGSIVGYNNQLRGDGGLIIGNNSASSGTNNLIIGNGINTFGNNNIIIGHNVSNTGSNNLYLTNNNIAISGSNTVDIKCSGSGIALSATGIAINLPITANSGQFNSLSVSNLSINGGSGIIIGSGTTGYLSKFVSNSSIGSGTIFDNGNIGIGTNNPQYKLHVVGDVAVSGASGIYYFNAPSVVGPTFSLYIENNQIVKSSSSIYSKENIQIYNKGLEEVLKLQPVSFNYIGGSRRTAGLIAEAVNTQGLEEFIVKNENGNPADITYAQMVVLLVNSIKELKNQIDELKTKINN